MHDEFIFSLENIAKRLKEADKPIKIITHLDCDGLSAASIMIAALKREDKKFSVSVVKQITENALKEISNEHYEIIVFLDLGSGCANLIKENLKKEIFILDHHMLGEKTDLIHVNPHMFGIDGNAEISGAGISYLCAKLMNKKNADLAHLAVIGAIGDMQENKGFSGINKLILDDAVKIGKIEVKNGLRMFGMQTKPIHKALEYSTDSYIPNVTGNESGAIEFLKELGINYKIDDEYRKIVNLDEEEMKKLVTGIILRRLGSEDNPDDVLGPIYLLKEENDEMPTKDAKEFATLLNSCGRLLKPSLGIGTCLGDKKAKEEAIELLINYKRELISSLDWFYKNRNKNVLEEDGFVIINAGDNIKDTLIGTLLSMIAKSNFYKDGTIIIGMANTLDNNIKISFRVAGRVKNIRLNEIASNIGKMIGESAGGHVLAAGMGIPIEKEEKFIESAINLLKRARIEEMV